MRLKTKLPRAYNKTNYFFKFLKSFKLGSNFFYWLIPLVFLMLAVMSLLAFVYNARERESSSVTLKPERIINVTEHFSGKIYFNNDFGQTELSKVIIDNIDQAKTSIEIAVYSMDHSLIRDALYRAANRGVKVALILSDKQIKGHNKVFKDLPKNIERLDVKSNNDPGGFNGLMHNKFLIIDRATTNEKLLFGSYNFTLLQEKYDPSFLMVTARPEIVKVFGDEFDKLHSGLNGEKKAKQQYNPFAALINYPEGYLEIWFCPQLKTGGLRDRLLGLIKGSKSKIEILIWNLTDDLVAKTLAEQAANKQPIKILTDDVNFFTKDSAFPIILAEKKLKNLDNLEILTDARRNEEIKNKFKEIDLNSFLHHHLLLVDDKIALFGTNNWSAGGFFSNDESTMITNIPEIFTAFQKTFQANYDKAK